MKLHHFKEENRSPWQKMASRSLKKSIDLSCLLSLAQPLTVCKSATLTVIVLTGD